MTKTGKLALRPALEFDLPTLADLMTRSFEGYLVPIRETPVGLAARLRFDSIDMALSRVALIDGTPVGLLWAAVRGWSVRIAAMGVVSEARRKGVGRALMNEAIATMERHGFERLVLEVIEQNAPAVALYRDLEFRQRRRLVGYELDVDPIGLDEQSRRDAESLVVVDSREVGRLIATEAEPDLPWQLASETLSTYGPSVEALQLAEKAWMSVHDSGQGPVVVQGLIVPRAYRRRQWGSRLLRALWAKSERRPLRIPARVPEDLGGDFFTNLGFRRESLTQFEMERAI